VNDVTGAANNLQATRFGGLAAGRLYLDAYVWKRGIGQDPVIKPAA